MKTRMQFCPVCQKQTPHRYVPISLLVVLILCLCGVFPAFIYIWVAFRRADRTATCTVDHAAAAAARDEEKLRSMIMAMRTADQLVARVNADEPVKPRGTGFMRDR